MEMNVRRLKKCKMGRLIQTTSFCWLIRTEKIHNFLTFSCFLLPLMSNEQWAIMSNERMVNEQR